MQSLALIGVAIPAAAVITNNLAGQAIEYQGKAVTLTIYGNSSAVTTTHSLFGNQGDDSKVYIPPGSVMGIGSTATKVKTNEDFLGMFAIPANTRLVHQINGVAAVLVNVLYIVT
jgi:hypothetical protein